MSSIPEDEDGPASRSEGRASKWENRLLQFQTGDKGQGNICNKCIDSCIGWKRNK